MTQAQITVLRFPDNVRLRKEMYLIDPNHCIYEILDNAVDEYSAGRCNQIEISVLDKNDPLSYIYIKDNGGGIPTTSCNDPEYKGHSQAYVALGALTTSGKYGSAGKDGYTTITSGLHGVGAACVNAVSKKFLAEIRHNGYYSELNFEKGKCIQEKINYKKDTENKTGTSILFKLDKELWGEESFDLSVIYRRLHQLAFLNPGLTIIYNLGDGTENFESEVIHHSEGLKEYFSKISSTKAMIGANDIRITKDITDENVGNIFIDTVFNYNTGYTGEIYGFVNNVSTKSGDHISGFNAGIVKAISHYLNDNKDKYKTLIKSVTNDDFKEGLTSILSVKVMNPKFEGQSKASIKMKEVWNAVNNLVYEDFKLYLEQNPTFTKTLLDKFEKAAKARIAAKRAREAIRNAKNTLDSSLPGKLSACSNKSPDKSEIFLVEGKLLNCPR